MDPLAAGRPQPCPIRCPSCSDSVDILIRYLLSRSLFKTSGDVNHYQIYQQEFEGTTRVGGYGPREGLLRNYRRTEGQRR